MSNGSLGELHTFSVLFLPNVLAFKHSPEAFLKSEFVQLLYYLLYYLLLGFVS